MPGPADEQARWEELTKVQQASILCAQGTTRFDNLPSAKPLPRLNCKKILC